MTARCSYVCCQLPDNTDIINEAVNVRRDVPTNQTERGPVPNLHSGEMATDGLVSMATIHFVNGVITTILVNANFSQDLFHRFNGHFFFVMFYFYVLHTLVLWNLHILFYLIYLQGYLIVMNMTSINQHYSAGNK